MSENTTDKDEAPERLIVCTDTSSGKPAIADWAKEHMKDCDFEYVRADLASRASVAAPEEDATTLDDLRSLLDRYTQPCAADCNHSQCPLLRELHALHISRTLERAQQTVKPIVDRERAGEFVGDLMNMQLGMKRVIEIVAATRHSSLWNRDGYDAALSSALEQLRAAASSPLPAESLPPCETPVVARELNGDEDLTCPFCHESDFDLIGLKSHLGWCEVFDAVQAVSNPMVESSTSAPTVTVDQINTAAEAIAKRYTAGKGSVAVIAAIITRNLAGTPSPVAEIPVGGEPPLTLSDLSVLTNQEGIQMDNNAFETAEERTAKWLEGFGEGMSAVYKRYVPMIEQLCRDLNEAHNEILKQQGVPESDFGKYDWPEWSPQANSIRWAEQQTKTKLAKTDNWTLYPASKARAARDDIGKTGSIATADDEGNSTSGKIG